jgi:hypothetical protein
MDPTREKEMLYPPTAKRATVTPGAAVAKASPADLAPEPPAESELPPQAVDPLTDIWTTIFQNDGRVAQGFQILHERILAIETLLGVGPAAEESSPAAQEPAPPHPQREEPPPAPELPPPAAVVAPVAQPLPPQPVAQAAPMPQPVQPVRDVRPVNVAALIFPPDFARQPELKDHRQQLLHGVRHEDPATVGLVGELLIFRSSTIDKMPQVVKDVGEAWYRWRPDRAGMPDPFRDALIDWLHRRMEMAGLTHRVALVHVGDRYDSKRHNTQGRGVEVTEVFGWLVLRDNGSVYTKASVAVA